MPEVAFVLSGPFAWPGSANFFVPLSENEKESYFLTMCDRWQMGSAALLSEPFLMRMAWRMKCLAERALGI